jgi:hypothetical protein
MAAQLGVGEPDPTINRQEFNTKSPRVSLPVRLKLKSHCAPPSKKNENVVVFPNVRPLRSSLVPVAVSYYKLKSTFCCKPALLLDRRLHDVSNNVVNTKK